MKRYTFIAALFIALNSFAQDAAVFEGPVNGHKISFVEEKFEFGDIVQGTVVEHVFEFTNTGTAPLILQDVRTTCGCTVPVWPREPIPAGEKSKLTVKFNSTGKVGVQNKVITILSNAVNQSSRVMIVTNVTPKPS